MFDTNTELIGPVWEMKNVPYESYDMRDATMRFADNLAYQPYVQFRDTETNAMPENDVATAGSSSAHLDDLAFTDLYDLECVLRNNCADMCNLFDVDPMLSELSEQQCVPNLSYRCTNNVDDMDMDFATCLENNLERHLSHDANCTTDPKVSNVNCIMPELQGRIPATIPGEKYQHPQQMMHVDHLKQLQHNDEVCSVNKQNYYGTCAEASTTRFIDQPPQQNNFTGHITNEDLTDTVNIDNNVAEFQFDDGCDYEDSCNDDNFSDDDDDDGEFSNSEEISSTSYSSPSSSKVCLSGQSTKPVRKSRHDDLTPNPAKLHKIGQDLKKLNKAINELAHATEIPSDTRLNFRKEKNKLASRACRLKKKQSYESNKVILYGLEKENQRVTGVLQCIKQELRKYQINPNSKTYLNTNWTRKLKDIERSLRPTVTVAGRTSEYVDEVMQSAINSKKNKKH